MKDKKDTAKRIEIDKFKEEFKGLRYSELNAKAIELAYTIMRTSPNSWKDELKTNRKHSAILELMKEIKER